MKGQVRRPSWVINGKWLSAETTGTQRYSDEILRRVVGEYPESVVLALPRNAVVPDWAASIDQRQSRFRGVLFEQVVLPFIARRCTLLTTAGPAPMLARRQVVTLHDIAFVRYPESVNRLFATWYRLMYRVATRRRRTVVTSVSRFSASELETYYGLPTGSVAVVPCGAEHLRDVDAARPAVADQLGPGFIVCIGTLAPRKNLSAVLPALERAGIPTVVVGSAGPGRIYGAAPGGNPDRGDVIQFPGRLSDAEICWLLDHADALIFPSRYEGFGLPIVEAQSRGCPVLCVGDGAMAEVGGDAIIAIAADGSDIVERIGELRSRRSELVAAGHRNIERYGWDPSAMAYARLAGFTSGAVG